MKIYQFLQLLFSLSAVTLAQSFCENHNGYAGESSGEITGHVLDKSGNVDYELWYDVGDGKAIFYPDGSFTCSFQNITDYICRSGVNMPVPMTPDEIGHIKAEFKVDKQEIEHVWYSYIGVYGWTLQSEISPVFEYYIIDDWLTEERPGEWIATDNLGDFIIDGAEYTVFKNVKGLLIQYISLRKTPRSCGTIDVTAHIEQWEKLGLKMGKITEIKVLAENGHPDGSVYGSVAFPYAKVYINGVANTDKIEFNIPVEEPTDNVEQDVPLDVEIEPETESDSVIDVDQNDTIDNEVDSASDDEETVDGFCGATGYTGESSGEITGHVLDKSGNVDYELWYDVGDGNAVFYSDGSFTCSFQNITDYICRSGVNMPVPMTPDEIGHIKAEFKVDKQEIEHVWYSYIGVYGWTLQSEISPVFEYYIIDDWLTEERPGEWIATDNLGDFIIDGAEYTVFKNVKGLLIQYISLRKTPRSCGTIDVTAHIEQWEKLGLKMGKITEIKVLAENGHPDGSVYGSVAFPYAKVYINGVANTDKIEFNIPVEEPTDNIEQDDIPTETTELN